MKLCFPVKEVCDFESRVYGHFGSAPAFVIVDTGTSELKAVRNNDGHHAHGMCSPLKALGGENVDAVIVSGIGAGALTKLNSAGIEVYRAFDGTIGQNLELFELKRLPRFAPSGVCSGHNGCAHH